MRRVTRRSFARLPILGLALLWAASVLPGTPVGPHDAPSRRLGPAAGIRLGPDNVPPRIISLVPTPGEWIVDNIGLAKLDVGFDEPVTVPKDALLIWSVAAGPLENYTTAYDSKTHILTVMFDPPVRDDRLTVVIDYNVVDLAGNELDGETDDPANATLPSGDTRRGGQAVFRINILQGDANRDGIVDLADETLVAASLGPCAGDAGFDPNADLNRDGCVNVLDAGIVSLGQGKVLPSTDGVAPLVTQITPDPAADLSADITSVVLDFSEAVDPATFTPGSCFLLDGIGALHNPFSAMLAPDGMSATYDFAGPLSKCPGYALNISNSLADASGSLLFPPPAIPTLTPPVPAVPVLDPHTTMTMAASVMVSGNASDAVAVEISGPQGVFEVPVAAGTFTADVPLRENFVNHIFFTSKSPECAVPSAPASTMIRHDAQPPELFIDFPADGSVLNGSTTDVAGRVGDVLSGFVGLAVTVNGIAAIVDVGIGNNGTFLAQDVPLLPGEPTVIIATGTDTLGNTAYAQVSVTREDIPLDAPHMIMVSGNGQTGIIGAALPAPVVVQVLLGDGTPFANKIVTFHVRRSNGRLTETPPGKKESGSLMLQVRTDARGEATAFWRLGFDAGCGNNRVEVTSTSIAGTVGFCASATPAPAAQINVGSGNNQRAEAGGPAPEPLRVWVNDACNGVPGVLVSFAVTRGDGKIDGQSLHTVVTSDTGHAEVDFMLSGTPGNNVVEATFPGNPGRAAEFVVFGTPRSVLTPTSFSGLVLDNASQPIGGATCRLVVGDEPPLVVMSDVAGQFRMENIASSGPADLFVDGTTATSLAGSSIPPGSFPALHFEPVVIPNSANSLPMSVLLPPLDPANAVPFDNTQDVELTVQGVEGLKMTVRAGSMTRADGTVPAPGDPAILALNQVQFEDVPMPMPDGAAPPFAWTLQPGGAMFDPPVEITYPNMSGLPAGSIAYFLSFNHDTSRFEIVATGQVTADGSLIESDPGAGISTSGWGCNCPPYAVTGDCENECPEGSALLAGPSGEEECVQCPELSVTSLTPSGMLTLGEDLAIQYEIEKSAFDAVVLEIHRASDDALIFSASGLSTGVGIHSATWPKGMWNQGSSAFANPANGPYVVTIRGNKGPCNKVAIGGIDTKLVLQADIEDKPPSSLPSGVTVSATAGLADVVDALKVIMRLGGDTIISGSVDISISDIPDGKHVTVTSVLLDTLADGTYEVFFRDLRDEIGNFADDDDDLSNNAEIKVGEVELQ